MPQIDVNINVPGAPAVFTAHDLMPRRTADRRDLWLRLLRKFDRVVVHTAFGRESLAELGIDPVVISHPVYPSAAGRADDGQTLLALGVIRPYKGLPDAIEVNRRLPDARLLVAGDPAMELGELRDAPRTEWRLGYLTQVELDRALTDATVALFPYRAELDQSGALLQALGAGVPAVVYDVGGARRAGRLATGPAASFPPPMSRRSPRRRASSSPTRPAPRGRPRRRRAGARGADLGGGGGTRTSKLYEEPVLIFCRSRFAEVIATQLDQFAVEHRFAIEEVNERLAALQRRGPTDEAVRSSTATTSTRSRRPPSSSPTSATTTRAGHLEEGVRTSEYRDREFNRAVDRNAGRRSPSRSRTAEPHAAAPAAGTASRARLQLLRAVPARSSCCG